MCENETAEFEEWKRPPYRFKLRALIISKGFRTTSDFARAMGVSITQVARVIGGWAIPGEALARRMAEALGIDLKELAELTRNGETNMHNMQ